MKPLALTLALALAALSCVAQDPPAPPAPTAAGANPALLYWQAIGMLPDLSAEQVRLIPQVLGDKVSLADEKVVTMLAQASKSLDRFARAAAVTDQPCAWGTTLDEGPFAPMPHLPKFQMLCRLTLIRAETLFAKGQPGQALESLLTVHRATRHMASDLLLITVIMQHGIEQQIIRQTARHVLQLDESTRQTHLRSLRNLPPLRTLREALPVEHKIAEWLRHSVIGIEQSPESEKALLEISQALLEAQSQSKNASTAETAKQNLASLAEYKLSAEQARDLQSRLMAICDHPWTEFKKEMGQVHADLIQAPGAVRSMLSAVEGARRKELESKTLRIMLEAALTLGSNVPDGSIVDYKDAFTEAPIQVKKEDKLITLSSRDYVNGKPLQLRLAR